MSTHLRVLSESYLMNTNMTGFRCFSKTLHPYALDESRLSSGRFKYLHIGVSHVRMLYDNAIGIRCLNDGVQFNECLLQGCAKYALIKIAAI